jgi:hypothetical protein
MQQMAAVPPKGVVSKGSSSDLTVAQSVFAQIVGRELARIWGLREPNASHSHVQNGREPSHCERSPKP